MHLPKSEKLLVEHYVYATAAAAVAIWSHGDHRIKHVAFAAVVGVVGPLIAKFNPWGIIAQLAKQEHLDSATTAALTTVATAAVADAQKAVAKAAVDAAK